MEADNTSNTPVKTVKTSLKLLEYLKQSDGATLQEISEEFDIAKSTTHRHLSTLHNLEFVVKEKRVYYPSLRFLDFSEYNLSRKKAYTLAKEKVEEMAQTTDERAQFLVEEHGKGIYLHRATGSNAVRTDPGIGKRVPLHSIAAGKVILASLDDDEVEQIIDKEGLSAVTNHTITEREKLFSQLEKIRERGYSFNREENVDGVHAVGVPIMGPNDKIAGGLSVSGPTHRMKGEWFNEELPDLLLGIGSELELNIIYS